MDNSLICIVGCGGTGGFLAQQLGILLPPEKTTIALIDGDKVEPKNLTRQWFSRRDINRPKATQLGIKLQKTGANTQAHTFYLGDPQHPLEESFAFGDGAHNAIFCAADNHPARATVLDWSDATGVPCIIAGNEYWDAEAYFYHPVCRNTKNDPRVYYPELLDSQEGNPLTPSCTGKAQEEDPQLLTANTSSATYALWLYTYWFLKRKQMPDSFADVEDYEPVLVRSNAGRITTVTAETGA